MDITPHLRDVDGHLSQRCAREKTADQQDHGRHGWRKVFSGGSTTEAVGDFIDNVRSAWSPALSQKRARTHARTCACTHTRVRAVYLPSRPGKQRLGMRLTRERSLDGADDGIELLVGNGNAGHSGSSGGSTAYASPFEGRGGAELEAADGRRRVDKWWSRGTPSRRCLVLTLLAVVAAFAAFAVWATEPGRHGSSSGRAPGVDAERPVPFS